MHKRAQDWTYREEDAKCFPPILTNIFFLCRVLPVAVVCLALYCWCCTLVYFALPVRCHARKPARPPARPFTPTHTTYTWQSLENVKREIEIMRKVNHPNCIKLYDIYETSKHVYMVMELVRSLSPPHLCACARCLCVLAVTACLRLRVLCVCYACAMRVLACMHTRVDA
jgi:serine/threonine protein kinase